MVKRPIDSFVKYFLDIKPYHTKILEVVERYEFAETIEVDIKEKFDLLHTFANNPLCKGVGYGLDFDDECGFSASSCCDLFNCLGGYGLIFDNSDLLVSAPVTAFDNENATITVSGDRRFDSYFQIETTLSNNILKIRGNVVSRISPHHLFIIAPVNTYAVIETVADGFYVQGNVQSQFLAMGEFEVVGSTANDDRYGVANAIYRADQNRTYIKIFRADLSTEDTTDFIPLDINSLGKILIRNVSKNSGAYQRTDAYFDGTHTIIVLSSTTPLLSTNELIHGSVVLRTGLMQGRYVWLNDGSGFPEIPTISEAKILNCTYNLVDDTTTLLLEIANSSVYDTINNIFTSTAQLDLSTILTVDLRGYYFGAGFDGLQECSTPKPPNIHTTFSEFLSIEVVQYEGMRMVSGGNIRVTTDGDVRII